MKQYQWEIELMRRIDGELKSIRKTKIWEFDDDCLDFNLWGGAVQEFQNELKVGDVIKTRGNKTEFIRYNEDGTGTILGW